MAFLKWHIKFLTVVTVGVILLAGLAFSSFAFSSRQAARAAGGNYVQTNLVSDLPNLAQVRDKSLINSWGLSHSPNGPWQVSDNGTGVSTQYTSVGKQVPPVVTIPTPAGVKTAAPTGNVFNSTIDFVISKNGKFFASQFIFATEDGTISGFNPNVDSTHAILAVDRSAVSQGGFTGAVYKGLALATSSSGNFLFATNFRFGMVEKFDAQFNLVKSFTDPALASDCPIAGPPAQCFAPFGIQSINDQLYVTFALQNAAHHDDVASPGNGFVDIFDTNGNLLTPKHLISNVPLNSPWGLALAPANFGQFSNDLLVGNFGDGGINAFDPVTGASLGPLRNGNGNAITINGLWGLAFGNGGLAGNTNTLFFAAGFNDEIDGLFGSIVPA
jgi:uncharacterized protein (TIGR03118 family)